MEICIIVDLSFNIEKIMECGQCFHYKKLGVKEYLVYGKESICTIRQLDNFIYLSCLKEYIEYWKLYFSFNIDYVKHIKDLKHFAILHNDAFILKALEKGQGIRILNQPLFEICISYILSQQNRIPRIQQMVFQLSDKFSSVICELNGQIYKCFPTYEDLQKVSQKDYEELHFGYRSEYLYKFCQNWNELKDKFTMEYKKDKELLLTQKGIGEKVANCICLYGLNEYDAFPIDTWMKKIIQEEYTEKGKLLITPEKFAGILQQYMFYTKRLERGL